MAAKLKQREREVYLAARLSGKSKIEARQLAGIGVRLAQKLNKLSPADAAAVYIDSRGETTKEGLCVILSTAAKSAPTQYQSALWRLYADIKGWTKPQSEEIADKASERLQSWLTKITSSSEAVPSQHVEPVEDNDTRPH